MELSNEAAMVAAESVKITKTSKRQRRGKVYARHVVEHDLIARDAG